MNDTNFQYKEVVIIEIYIKVIRKVIFLCIITFLPLLGYLYLSDEAQTTLIANIDDDINKYIIEAQIDLKFQQMNLYEKVILRNDIKDFLDKIYINIYSESINIKKVYINTEEVNFKTIGKDRSVVMILPKKAILLGEKIEIEFICNVDMKNFIVENDSQVYNLTNWYPVIAKANEKGWDIKNKLSQIHKNKKNSYNIRVIVPKDYLIITEVLNFEFQEIENDRHIYHIQNINKESIGLIIEGR